MEPEKQPMLANGSETTFVSRQRLGKHVPPATHARATTELLFETVFFPFRANGATESFLYSSLWGKGAAGGQQPLRDDLSA
jgi:hypothetical protein